jgi:Leucine-rich repeat (LRR) protein
MKTMGKREFTINKFLTLKLEGGKTYIYVADEKFKQCRFLMINIPVEEVSNFDEIRSIDEAAEIINPSMRVPPEPEKIRRDEIPTYKIHPEEEFWGLCSNLQVWYEHGYNTRLLHANLSFPLLKRLADVGDLQAKRIFKEEIVERYNTGVESVREYLRSMKYLNYLSTEELLSIIDEDEERNAVLQLTRQLFRTDYLDIDIKKGKLIKIRLQGQKFTKVLDLIRSLTSLEHLILSYNSIEELPEWIGELQNLRVLEITNNCLKTLPDAIGDLKLLEHLKARGNKIEYLPESFGNLESIKILELYRNKIEKLPESIGNLSNLELLDLHENKLITLPVTIGKLTNLEKLIVKDNHLKDLPLSIGNLKNLKGLFVSKNVIKVLPESMKNLINLEILAIYYNPINVIPRFLYWLPNLRVLIIDRVYFDKFNIKEEDFGKKKVDIIFIKYEEKSFMKYREKRII